MKPEFDAEARVALAQAAAQLLGDLADLDEAVVRLLGQEVRLSARQLANEITETTVPEEVGDDRFLSIIRDELVGHIWLTPPPFDHPEEPEV